ncbi:hypothetical protein IFU40_06250 [Microbacterium sp. CFBP 13617]|uniref:hypothetical protein n=1 Tax=Microbacterium sp. CFBP 13617 TaxID=2774035 RepID=UPI00177B79B1|nr:hypothetical protein [Microbacterium sp. CFBP 13617]MBD8218234.1 hypothetical protein [Microbacterium sp. CFBP 13617]
MSIETDITVTLAKVEVGDDYDVELTTTDPLTGDQATISLTPAQAGELADELRLTAATANEARAVDDVARVDATATHGFDIDWPVQS